MLKRWSVAALGGLALAATVATDSAVALEPCGSEIYEHLRLEVVEVSIDDVPVEPLPHAFDYRLRTLYAERFEATLYAPEGGTGSRELKVAP